MNTYTTIVILTFFIVAVTAQPPTITCPEGTSVGGFAPIPKIHCFRSAVHPDEYVPDDYDNIWNYTFPFEVVGDDNKRMFGLNGYIRKNEEIVAKFTDMGVGQAIKVIPMIPRCDSYKNRALKLQLYRKNASNPATTEHSFMGAGWDLLQTRVNKAESKGSDNREVFEPYWLPEGYPAACLQFCPAEPLDKVIYYETESADEEVLVVATLLSYNESKGKAGDVFILKTLTDVAAHTCQTLEEQAGYTELRKALWRAKSLHRKSCLELDD